MTSPTVRTPEAPRAPLRRTRRRRVLVLAGAVVVLAAALAGVLIIRQGDNPAKTTPGLESASLACHYGTYTAEGTLTAVVPFAEAAGDDLACLHRELSIPGGTWQQISTAMADIQVYGRTDVALPIRWDRFELSIYGAAGGSSWRFEITER